MKISLLSYFPHHTFSNDHYGLSADEKKCDTVENCENMRDSEICDSCESYFEIINPEC